MDVLSFVEPAAGEPPWIMNPGMLLWKGDPSYPPLAHKARKLYVVLGHAWQKSSSFNSPCVVCRVTDIFLWEDLVPLKKTCIYRPHIRSGWNLDLAGD